MTETGGSLIIDDEMYWIGRNNADNPYKLKSGDIDYQVLTEEEYERLRMENSKAILTRNMANNINWLFPRIPLRRAMELADRFAQEVIDESGMVLGRPAA